MTKRKTIAEKRAEQASGVVYGCHDGGPGNVLPDCVLDYGVPTDCMLAMRHRCREACKHWQPTPSHDSPRAAALREAAALVRSHTVSVTEHGACLLASSSSVVGATYADAILALIEKEPSNA